MINPGLCKTSLTRSTEGAAKFVMDTVEAMLSWTAEEGSRTIVHAVMAGPTSHGAFLRECQVKKWASFLNIYLCKSIFTLTTINSHWVASWLLQDGRGYSTAEDMGRG